MRYWPISDVRSSLRPEIAEMLDTALATRKLSTEVWHACVLACMYSPSEPLHGLVLIKDDPLPKHAYLERPSKREFWLLERSCVCQNFDGEMLLIISALH